MMRALFLVLVMVNFGQAAEPSSRLPGPLTRLPTMPKDGAGIYRLSLEGALGPAPLILLLHVNHNKVTQAVSLPVHLINGWFVTDASKLTCENGTLTGSLSVQPVAPFTQAGPHSRRHHGKPNPKFVAPYEIKPEPPATITLDARCDGLRGSGRFTAQWPSYKGVDIHYAFKPSMAGNVTIQREPTLPVPEEFECDLYLSTALGDSPIADGLLNHPPAMWLRLAFSHGKAMPWGYTCLNPQKGSVPIVWSQTKASLVDGKLSATLTGKLSEGPQDAITLEIAGRAIGRRLFGTVDSQIGESKITTQWVGFLNDSPTVRLPMSLADGNDTWVWQHDHPGDAKLSAQAIEESSQPVLPGEPGKAAFWTWRALVHRKVVSVIYPPAFDIQETSGAKEYRFRLTPSKNSQAAILEFKADKPWKPLTPIWKQMPAGSYELTITPLDAQGNEIPGPMRMGLIDKTSVKATTQELKSIAIIKRPTFTGPYTKTTFSGWQDAALATSRFHRATLGYPERRGHSISQTGNHFTLSGDHGFGVTVSGQVWANLANRALTSDLAERMGGEDLLAFVAENFEIHQRQGKVPGAIYDYQANTPMMHWSGEAMLDAYLETGDPRWKAMALKLGQALVQLQNANGSFATTAKWPERIGPHGFFSWKEGYKEYSAIELLYLLGRIRRDLTTNDFVEAERKAYDWSMNVALRERFFPLNLAHSMSQGYPIWMHGVTALYFSRYLLECAPPERRDVKLAEELARWAEDFSIHWTRAGEGKQTGPLTPRVEKIDRYNNESVATNLLAAVVFEELGQATDNRLWAAKGEALTAAVLQARDPKTGRFITDLQPRPEDWLGRQFHDAQYRHCSFSNDWATQLLREYAHLRRQAK